MSVPGMALFTGKGGAGKTTCAAAFALALLRSGRPTLVLSLDPAHNLGDVLGLSLGPEPVEVLPGLRAMEPDLEAAERRRVDEAREMVRSRYRYLTVASMEPLIDLLGESPGQPEQAATEVLSRCSNLASDSGETLVVDLPPSGQAYRILTFPSLMERWCVSLARMRGRILTGRKTLDRLLGEDSPARAPGGGELPSDRDDDPVTGTLRSMIDRFGGLAAALADGDRARIIGVTLPEALSIEETRRLCARLGEVGLALSALVLNRAGPGDELPDDLIPDVVLPELDETPTGPDALSPLADVMARIEKR